ncbi:neprilysin-4-like isoform X2 [Mya arenaria]|uniref:neprilysin-4-like isoform X2 n=1 Tax=Mya arenaria TaxID=6604 RepID=UPI0022E01BA2|nr:neprilysin-4-like isoform X2 [Mya arenaria]
MSDQINEKRSKANGEVVVNGIQNGNLNGFGSKNGGRARKQKGLILLVILLFAAVIGLAIALGIVANAEDDTGPEICQTADCAQAAARVLENIDTSVDPCDNFYMYSCGAWKRKHVIPEDKSSQNVFGVLRDNVQVINKYLLEDGEKYKTVEGVGKAQDMYAGCVNTEEIERKSINVSYPLLQELGGWPVLGDLEGGGYSDDSFNLTTLLRALRKYNNNPLIDIYVSSDVKDSENNIIYLDQPSFGLPGRLYYLDSNLAHMRDAYIKLARGVAELFGADSSTAQTYMDTMLKLETDIANITMPSEDRRDNEALYNKMTIQQLTQNFTEPSPKDNIQFGWLEYMQGIMSLEGVDIELNSSEPVVVRAVPYFQKLFHVLQNYTKNEIANYLVWSIMKNRASNLPESFTDLVAEYNAVVYGQATKRARWRTCEDYVTGQMGMAIGHMFVRETFDESAKSIALDMIGNIRNAFNELLDELDWMDPSTKELAREKAKAVREWIGYPADVADPEKITELYENVTVSRTEHFQNVLGGLNRASTGGLKRLREKYNKNVWTTPPSTVNAYYNSILNAIMFPAGILQPPFYSKTQPKSMNYGGIGVVIGHEISHGFDDRGRQYDKDGNLVQWWSDTIINNFKEKAKCIVDQYGDFLVREANLTINGINTQGENIADNGGLKQSFRAYRRWVESMGKEEPMLPGLNYTHNQLFFINFAQIWCNNMRRESVINAINTGVHSPGEFRVIGTLQNSPDFATAFGCKKSNVMNPEKKCYVW